MALESSRKVRLPFSRTRRSQVTFATLLKRVDPRSRSPFEWQGTRMSPGSTIAESDLWPDGSYPRRPLLVEFAGAENPARGWNRHRSPETVILWRYAREKTSWVEVGRVSGPAATWAMLMEPLVRVAMAEEGGVPPVDLDLIRERIARVITAELDLVADVDRARVLCLVHDEIAGRIAEWMPEPAGAPALRVF